MKWISIRYLKISIYWLCCLLILNLSVSAKTIATQQNDLQDRFKNGYLRVGLSKHDLPYSVYRYGKYSGFEIDLAKSLADYLHVRIQFVPTTPLHLTRDLRADQFDLILSDLANFNTKHPLFLFSKPIIVTDKAAVMRCADKSKYVSFADIDSSGVRVVEEQNSRNAKYVHDHVQYARLILTDKKTTALHLLTFNHADVMLMNVLEANYYLPKFASLCLVNLQPPLQPEQKVFLLTRVSFNF